MAYTAQQVTFPFSEALPAAAALYRLAGQIMNDVAPARAVAANTALDQWQGTYAQDFVVSMRNSGASAVDTARALENAAGNLANAWVEANHQQQLYLYFAMVQHKRDHRSFLSGLSDDIFGDHTNYGSQPPAPSTPGPPGFGATQVPQAYVPGESPPPLA